MELKHPVSRTQAFHGTFHMYEYAVSQDLGDRLVDVTRGMMYLFTRYENRQSSEWSGTVFADYPELMRR